MVRHSTDKGLDERDSKLLETLEQWGWFVTKVGATNVEPAFAYSMGLYEHFRHPELILFGLDLSLMHRLINDLGEQIRHGQIFRANSRCDSLLKGYPCEFRAVNPRNYDGFLNYAVWYYRGPVFPTLQLIWPDNLGRFPWDQNFDEDLRKRQPALYESHSGI